MQPSPDQPAEDEIDAVAAPPAGADGRVRSTGIIAWVVSGALHATLAMLLGTIYFLSAEPEQEIPPVRVQNIPPPPERKEDKPKSERQILDPKVTLEIENRSEDPSPVTALDLPIEDAASEAENDSQVPKGREEAVADAEMGGQGAFMAIGAGGGGAGAFGNRSGGGRKRAVGRSGGTRGSESAVEAALRWFKRHQGADGAWHAATYQNNCTESGPKCETGKNHRNGENEDAGLTGLAVLCYLGAGYDHKTPNTYRQVVARAIDWLLSVQKPNGVFLDGYTYEQAMATMALAEAYAMSGDSRLRKPTQDAVDLILSRRMRITDGAKFAAEEGYPLSGLGWGDFKETGEKTHGSACGWSIQALKSAFAAGLDVKDGLRGSKTWLRHAWAATCRLEGKDPLKLDPYRDTSTLSYYWNRDTDTADALGAPNQIHNLAGVALLAGVFLGVPAGDPLVETTANHVMRYDLPKDGLGNLYYTYYATFGIFQMAGERWKTWNEVVRDRFVDLQRKEEGCFDGSWDWERNKHYANDVGRLLSTALSCLTLEVYYRYAQVHPEAKAKAVR